jgi:hypothetical protein
MDNWIDIILVVFFSLAFLIVILIFTDKFIFLGKLKKAVYHMTGKEVISATKLKFRILKISGNQYIAAIYSPLHISKKYLVFVDGHLEKKIQG